MTRIKRYANGKTPLSRRVSVINFLRDVTRRNLWAALGVLAAGLIITMLAVLYVKADVEAAAEREFNFICNEIQINIADRLAHNAQILRSGAALFDASETITREEWRIFTQSLQVEQQLPGTQGIGFALLIPPDQLDQHIQKIRNEGFPDYKITPTVKREVYSSIIYLEPFSGRNLRAFGYDMFSEPVRRTAMELARDKNTAVLSGKVILVQETDEDIQASALMYVPVYGHGLPIDTVEQRRAAIIGWVYSPYRMTDLMRGALRDWEAKEKNRQIYLQVYDGDRISTDTLLYDSQSATDTTLTSTALVTKLTAVDFAGSRWTLRFTQVGGLASTADYDSVWIVLFGGIIISLLLFWLIFSLLNTRANAQWMAEQLTTELRESEEKYGAVFHNEVYGISIFDLETLKLLDVNEAYVRLYGYSREELLSGMTVHDITAEEQASDTAIAQATREGTTIIPTRYHRKKDGTIFPVELVAGAYVWQGRKVMFALLHNITERKQVEDALRESEVRFRVMADTTPVLIWMSGTDALCYYFNKPWLDFTGRTMQEEMGNGWTEGIHPDDYQYCLNIYLGAINAHTEFTMEYRLRRADGEYRWLLDNGVPRFTLDGFFLGYIGSCVDITERKQAEEQIIFLSSVTKDISDAILVTDTNFAITYLNKAEEQLFGYTLDEVKGKTADILNAEEMTEQIQKDIYKTVSSGNTYFGESLNRKKDGSTFICEYKVMPLLDSRGEIYTYVGIQRDITERKQTEEALRENEGKFRAIIEQSKDGIVLIDQQGYIMEWNRAQEQMTGIPRAEALSQFAWDIQFRQVPAARHSQVTAEHIKQNLLNILETGQSPQLNQSVEIQIQTVPGELRTILQNAFPIKMDKGYRLGVILHDITERKQAEDELRYAKSALEAANAELEQLAGTDVLTGINNHRSLLQHAEREFDVAMRYQPPLSMMFFDIDYFKQINDAFGHAIGDQALKKMIQIVCAELRSADVIGRYGGDEFVILLPQTSAQDALPLAERIHAAIAAMRLDTDKGALTLTISIGIAQTIHRTSQTDTVENLLLRADQALYAAKQTGRNRTVIFDQKLSTLP
jgi:diguanylate cyclase (GGDEF)-like protein/PAS domain S-box-containing protein